MFDVVVARIPHGDVEPEILRQIVTVSPGLGGLRYPLMTVLSPTIMSSGKAKIVIEPGSIPAPIWIIKPVKISKQADSETANCAAVHLLNFLSLFGRLILRRLLFTCPLIRLFQPTPECLTREMGVVTPFRNNPVWYNHSVTLPAEICAVYP